MPNASAPNAPCVEVWQSPQTMVMPGQGEALLRPDDVHDALAISSSLIIFNAELGAVILQRLYLMRGLRVVDAVAPVSGRHVVIDDSQRVFRRADRRPATRKPSNACGLVTSWIKWRSI